ncbi:MAG: 3'(2'),5'-bisphosphate nucleotidase [Candidatus Hydrogenedentes bacterium]|nr:3'(2'),5'-bisphosphate nucleotidase [Candidatus Hydrogenedentota bacterium]
MPFDDTQPEVSFAVNAVKQACILAASVQKDLVGASMDKADRSPVTVADFAVQAIIGCLLEKTFPTAPLVGEEDATALRQDENSAILQKVASFAGKHMAYATPQTVCEWIDHGNGEPGPKFWTLDPIDGTKGFLRGDQYAIALALIVDGQVQIGVLGCPNMTRGYLPELGGAGSLVVAVRGQGAWTTPVTGDAGYQQLRVSDLTDIKQARLLRSFESGHTNTGQIGEFVNELEINGAPVCMDSQAKYAVLGSGHGDMLLRLLSARQPDYRERIWDQAAGAIVVEEAGGRITDLNGRALDFGAGKTLAQNEGVCASNGVLHDAALEKLAEIRKRSGA